jgi:hypothetical protein
MAIAPNQPTPASSAAAMPPLVSDDQRTYLFSRASWGAIIAGVVAALVAQLLINLLGIGIGLSTVSVADRAGNPDASTFSIGAGIWWTLSGIIASFCGGVVAGRLCGAAQVNTARWHGLVTWCVTTLVIFYLLTTVLGGILGGTFSALSGTLSGVGRTAASVASGVTQTADTGNLEAQVRSLVNPSDTQSVQNNIVAYIRASASGDQGAANEARDRVVDSLARVANISPDEARARLAQVEQQYRQATDRAKRQATEAAEVARRNAARAGLFGFVALVLGAVAAWYGGGVVTPRHETAPAGTRRAF